MRVKEQRGFYQALNIVVPLLLLGAAAATITIIRKKRYRKVK